MTIIDRLQQMLSNGRDDAMLRFGLGSALFNEKKYDEAIVHLQKCIEHDPNYSAAYKLLGKAYFSTGQFEQAGLVFNQGKPVAARGGDKQTLREIEVFEKKIKKLVGT